MDNYENHAPETVVEESYTENQIRCMIQQGKSERYMTMKLATAGIDNDTVHHLLQEFESDELSRAIRYAQKKKLGFYNPKSDSDTQKDLAKMARAGFSYDIACKALNNPEE